MHDMDFVPSVSDPDVYSKWSRNNNGEDYYKLLTVYVDDILCCSHNPQLIMNAPDFMYDLKDGSMGPPTIYLGAEIKKYQVKSGKSH